MADAVRRGGCAARLTEGRQPGLRLAAGRPAATRFAGRPALPARRELQHQLPRMKMGNYTLNGIVGLELSRKTYGVVGTGNIGIEVGCVGDVDDVAAAPPLPPLLQPCPCSPPRAHAAAACLPACPPRARPRACHRHLSASTRLARSPPCSVGAATHTAVSCPACILAGFPAPRHLPHPTPTTHFPHPTCHPPYTH